MPATPTASVPIERSSPAVPETLTAIVTEGSVGYWMASPEGAGHVFRVDTGASSTWWWRGPGTRAARLDLPGDLEPALPSGTMSRWFHGATIDAAHLGSGSLRLFAVDVVSGEIVLNHALDRRLELAAMAVSGDGAVVAHVQGANDGVAFWVADLRGGLRIVEAGIEEAPVTAAASAIDLRVAADGDDVLVAAGLLRDGSGSPETSVYILRAAIGVMTIRGELIGIVPDIP
jgi:hypothetical protein